MQAICNALQSSNAQAISQAVSNGNAAAVASAIAEAAAGGKVMLHHFIRSLASLDQNKLLLVTQPHQACCSAERIVNTSLYDHCHNAPSMCMHICLMCCLHLTTHHAVLLLLLLFQTMPRPVPSLSHRPSVLPSPASALLVLPQPRHCHRWVINCVKRRSQVTRRVEHCRLSNKCFPASRRTHACGLNSCKSAFLQARPLMLVYRIVACLRFSFPASCTKAPWQKMCLFMLHTGALSFVGLLTAAAYVTSSWFCVCDVRCASCLQAIATTGGCGKVGDAIAGMRSLVVLAPIPGRCLACSMLL
jgi:hypothetical protein